MFVNLKIKNIGGIKELVDMNFISKARNKEQLNTCIKTPDDIYINKQVVFIGSNASGKSSVLKAIAGIGNFICAPIYRKRILEDIEANDNLSELKKFLTQLSIIKRNINATNEKSYFEADMFISSKDPSTTGYYKYQLDFDNNIENDGVISEILTYRASYKSKKETVIVKKNNVKDSHVGYLYLYANNLGTDEKIIKHVNEFVRHYTKFSSFIQASSFEFDIDRAIVEWVKKQPNEVIKLVNIFDKNIDSVEIIKEKNEREIIYFKTKDNMKLSYDDLSNGTKKMLVVIYQILQTVKENGVCLIDEIEMGLYKELVNLILRIFYIKNNYSQIIFTSNYPEIIDNKFKYDQVFCLKKEYDTTKITRLMDYTLEDGKKMRVDMSLAKAYANGKISLHPSKENIEEFVKNINIDF